MPQYAGYTISPDQMEAIKRHEQDGRKVMLLAVGGGRSMLIRAIDQAKNAIVERIPFEQERLAIR
jgi:hypothetical protein